MEKSNRKGYTVVVISNNIFFFDMAYTFTLIFYVITRISMVCLIVENLKSLTGH